MCNYFATLVCAVFPDIQVAVFCLQETNSQPRKHGSGGQKEVLPKILIEAFFVSSVSNENQTSATCMLDYFMEG